MAEVGARPPTDEDLVAAVRAGDQDAFAGAVERHRRELHVHCYRMTGSFEQAEELVQETFLRAWRRRAGLEGRASVRTWLYRIATNACLDALAHGRRRLLPHQVVPANVPPEALPSTSEVHWLEPYPDRLLDQVAPRVAEPEAALVARETVELAFLAAIQLLPPRQRAALLVRDVLGWSARETAELLDTSVTAANSALQRARETLARHRPASRFDWAPAVPTAEEGELLGRFMDAFERADAGAVAELLRVDARATMPPHPWWFDGRDPIVGSLRDSFGPRSIGPFRCVATRANGRPAMAMYLQRRDEAEFRPFVLSVLRTEGGLVAAITSFDADSAMFARFDLPPTA